MQPILSDLKKYDLIYLATPYTKYPSSIEMAFQHAAMLAARLLSAGLKIYSPITHTHPIAKYGGLSATDHTIWLAFDRAMIAKSDALLVAKMPTWDSSFGIAYELKLFKLAEKPVFYLDPDTMTVEK